MSRTLRRFFDYGIALYLLLLTLVGAGCDPEGLQTEVAVAPEAASEHSDASLNRESDAPADNVAHFDFMVGPSKGRWHEARSNRFDANLSEKQQQEVEFLEELGYVDGIHPASTPGGVTRHDSTKAFAGLNLLTSAHEATAILLDMDGNILHQWSHPFIEAWPRDPTPLFQPTSFWRRTHLFDNGDLLAIYEGHGIIRLDRDSNLLWKNNVRAHHDMAPMPNGSVWVLTREAHIVPRIHPKHPVLEDYVSLLGPRGGERGRISVLEALENSDFRHLWNGEPDEYGDLFHTNTIERLDGRFADRNPAFAEGNLLISLLLLDAIAVLDPRVGKIIWAMKGDFHWQHDPQFLENGNLMIFDNNPSSGPSGVLEIDPATGEERWAYRGNEVDPFYSETCGVSQRLPNGNTLITESDFGRAFEVTSDGEIVWEFVNPYRAGDDEEFIATMMEMKRLRPEFPVEWIDAQSLPAQ